jgi:hypothetical protein
VASLKFAEHFAPCRPAIPPFGKGRLGGILELREIKSALISLFKSVVSVRLQISCGVIKTAVELRGAPRVMINEFSSLRQNDFR